MDKSKKNESKVTPWNVEGKINYDKLIKEFGVNFISKEQKEYLTKLSNKKGLKLHLFLRRNLYFAQKDLEKLIEAHKNGEKIFLYTGRAIGGSMHIGHSIQFQFTKYLQDLFDCNLYIQFPDDEKYLFKKELKKETIKLMLDSDLKDVAAFGFNPDKTFIFKNSEYISNMFGLYLDVARRITFSQARNTFGFTNDSNIGMINYPALQIIPTFFEKNYCLIPCGIDQDPYFRLQRDFAQKMGFKKNITILSKFLTALTGSEGKMSASDPDKAILMNDNASKVKRKINKYAFSGGQKTIEEHRKIGGDTNIDVSYNWLYYLFEEDDEIINEIKINYESGKMLSGEIKSLLINKINIYLENHNKKKEEIIKANILNQYMYEGKLAKKMWSHKFD